MNHITNAGKENNKPQSRRDFLRSVLRGMLLVVLGFFGGLAVLRRKCSKAGGSNDGRACAGCPDLARCRSPFTWLARPVSTRRTIWQLDPAKCIQCGRCATSCVLHPSAVKCAHQFEMCGYCKLCFGFFQPGASVLSSAAENQMCPTGAIRRKYIEEPYYEYTIDESLCIGCGRCVKTCGAFGNGSLKLQVRHNLCVNCNECSIARHCPADAYRRVPADEPYLFKPVQKKT
jgi:electron transport complex protein RnfB